MYELNEDEGKYLKKIVIYTRKEYLRKNKYIFIEKEDIDEIDEKCWCLLKMLRLILKLRAKKKLLRLKLKMSLGMRKLQK